MNQPGKGRILPAYVGLYILFLYLPVALIPLFSFNDSVQAAFPLQGMTLSWYRALFDHDTLALALRTSLIVGVISSGIATAAGLAIAYTEIHGRGLVGAAVSALARLPILIPGVILGISVLILVNLAGIGPSKTALVAGHVLVSLPTTVIILRGRLQAIPRSLTEAATDLGAGRATVFFRVLLPLSMPAIGSAFLLAFLTSFDEFIVAFFLAGTEPTLPLFIWSQLRFPKTLPMVMALGSTILLVSIVIAIAAEMMRRRGLATASQA